MQHRERERSLGEVRRLLIEGDPRGALELVKAYLKRYRSDAAANALAGVAYAQLGEMVEAAAYFKESLAVDEDQYDISMMLVRALMEQGKWQEALPVAERLRRNYPNDKVLRVLLASIRDHVRQDKIGWDRDENRPRVNIEFTGFSEDMVDK